MKTSSSGGESRKSSVNQKQTTPTAAAPSTMENGIVDHYSVVKGYKKNSEYLKLFIILIHTIL